MEWPLPKLTPGHGGFATTSPIPYLLMFNLQAFKHVFTSPSSVDQEPKATRSGNARIHGMTQVTPASVAYVATQVSCVNASSLHWSNP
jgi:hypothetical protein